MVKKMKLKLWLCLVLSAFIARPALAANPGLHYINTRGNIRCGTETGNKILAYKDENGKWIQVPTYEYSDQIPYGHGEKSVYIISGYMRLTREEAFAIRYHMGFSGTEDARNVGAAFEMFPLAFALSTADMEATYYIEGKKQ